MNPELPNWPLRLQVASLVLVTVGGIALLANAGSGGRLVIGFAVAGLGGVAGGAGLVSMRRRAESDDAGMTASLDDNLGGSAVVDAPVILEVVGAATIPLPGIHGIIVSAPLATLQTNERGIRVRLSWRWLTKIIQSLMRRFGAAEGSAAEWRATWGSIDHALVGPRSVVLFRGGGWPCRFAVRKRAVARKVEAELVAHGVEIQHVRSTVRYAYYTWQPTRS
jgi:hypothetical protein